MNLLSVIVPVYNTEQYIERCIKSILNQKYNNIEILLINDGSTDKSLEICKLYAEKYHNIKVYSQERGGQSKARNLGMKEARGEFITFVDSDDWIDKNIYEFAIKEMIKSKAEVFDFGCKKTNKYIESNNLFNEANIQLYEKDKILEHYLGEGILSQNCPFSVCRKVFKKEVLNNIKFPIGIINEDIITVYNILKQASKMIASQEIGYFYFQRDKSTTRKGLRERDFDLITVCNEMYEDARRYGGKIEYYARIKKERCAFSILSKIAYYGIEDKTMEEKKIVKPLTKELRKNMFSLIRSPIPKNRKVLIICYCINFNIAKHIIGILKSKEKI